MNRTFFDLSIEGPGALPRTKAKERSSQEPPKVEKIGTCIVPQF